MGRGSPNRDFFGFFKRPIYRQIEKRRAPTVCLGKTGARFQTLYTLKKRIFFLKVLDKVPMEIVSSENLRNLICASKEPLGSSDIWQIAYPLTD